MLPDDEQVWIVSEEVAIGVDDSFITLSSLRLITEDLGWCLLAVTNLTHRGTLPQLGLTG